jgi:hypothetical protein
MLTDAQARTPPSPVGTWIAIEEKGTFRLFIVLVVIAFFTLFLYTEWIPNAPIVYRWIFRFGAVLFLAAFVQWIWRWTSGKILIRVDQAGIWLREYPEFEVIPWSQLLRISIARPNVLLPTLLFIELRSPDLYWARLSMLRPNDNVVE